MLKSHLSAIALVIAFLQVSSILGAVATISDYSEETTEEIGHEPTTTHSAGHGYCSVDSQLSDIRQRITALEQRSSENTDHAHKEDFTCYFWTTEDREILGDTPTPEQEQERCESYAGNVFTKGNNEAYTDCESCWCCKPKVPKYSVPEDRFIGFTAYLSYFANNLPIARPIVLDQTLLNEGGGYDKTTGKFTAPVSGFYSFTFVIETKNWANCVVRLVVDGVNTLDAVVEPRHSEQNLHGGNAGVIKLYNSQQVWLEPYQEYNQALEGGDIYRFTTFSGALLHRL